MVPSQYHPRGLFHVFTAKRSRISQRSSTPSQGSGESYTHARCVRVLKEVLDAICDNLGRLVNWSYSQEIRTSKPTTCQIREKRKKPYIRKFRLNLPSLQGR